MNSQLVNQLVGLNRQFYAGFAHTFSETRSGSQASLDKILTYISSGVKALDLGCGNGRLAQKLDAAGRELNYWGVDFSQELVNIAAARCARLRHVKAQFHVADITQIGWHRQASPLLGFPPLDAVLALAVLHHIPSFELRRAVLQDAHSLLRAGGQLIMTNWQFTNSARLRKKILPWQTIGVDEDELEPGDTLLDWKRGGTGQRYCHLVTENEAQRLAEQSGFSLVEQFYADANLNLYSVLAKAS